LEAGRNFVDVRSQLFLHEVLPANYTKTWCDPNRMLVNLAHSQNATAAKIGASAANTTAARLSPAAPSGQESLIRRAVNAAHDRLLGNFSSIANIGGRGVFRAALLLCVIASLLLFSVSGASVSPTRPTARSRRFQRRLTVVALAAIVCGLSASPFLINRLLGIDVAIPFAVRTTARLLVAGGVAFLVTRWIVTVLDRLLARAHVHVQSERQAVERRLLVLSLVIPWVILFVVAERGQPVRFLWLWPLEVLFLAAFAVILLPRLRLPRFASWLAQAFLVFLIVGNGFLVGRIDSWRAHGWSGHDSEEVRVVDYVARQLHSRGQDRTGIGYRIFIYPFMVKDNITNPLYKVGADLDLLFKYRGGITNTDTCAEGVSASDHYRIVRTTPMTDAGAPTEYFNVSLGRGFQRLRQFGPYLVYART
jgi:hypothetical protein